MSIELYDDKVKFIYKNGTIKEYKYNELLIIATIEKIKLVEKISGKYIKFLPKNEFEMLSQIFNVDVVYNLSV